MEYRSESRTSPIAGADAAHHCWPGRRHANVMDGADVGMVQCGRGPRLALEPLDSLRIGREGSREELQGDVPAELEILGLVHHAHAATADRAEHAIV